jgi:YD repeat-containing protein
MHTQLHVVRSVIASVTLVVGLFASGGRAANVSFTYDPAGRVTTAVYDNGTCIAYAYDASSNRMSQTNTVFGAPQPLVWGTGVWGCASWTP